MTTTANKINWKEVILFYLLVVAISLLFRLNLIDLSSSSPLPYGLNVWYTVFKALGPFVGYLVLF